MRLKWCAGNSREQVGYYNDINIGVRMSFRSRLFMLNMFSPFFALARFLSVLVKKNVGGNVC
jgi:hypothetical protein